MQSIKFLLSEREGVAGTLEMEAELLKVHWTSTECLNNMLKFFNSGELQVQLEHT